MGEWMGTRIQSQDCLQGENDWTSGPPLGTGMSEEWDSSAPMKGNGRICGGSEGAGRSGQHSEQGNAAESTSKKQQEKTNKQRQKDAVKEETQTPRSFC